MELQDKLYRKNSNLFKDNQLMIQLFFLIVSTIGMIIPYNNILKLIYEMAIIASLIIFTLKKPNLVLPIIFLTTISPIRSYGGLFSKEITFITFDNEMILIIALLVIILLKLFINKYIQIKKLIPLYILIFIFVLSYFYTDDYTRSTYYKTSFWVIVLSYSIVPLFIKSKSDLNVLIKSFALAFIQNAFLIIVKFLINGFNIDFESIINRNYFSLYIVIIMVASLIYVANNLKNSKLFNTLIFISFVPNVLMLFLLASRSAFIIILISLFVFLVLNIKNKKILIPIVLAVLVLVFLCETFNVTEVLFDRFQQDDVVSGNGRINILIAMLDKFIDRSVLEMSFGTGYYSIFVNTYGFLYGTHNSFLSYLMHYGIIGLLCFLVIFSRNIIMVIRNSSLKNYLIFLVAMVFYCCVAEPHIKGEFILIFMGIYSVIVNQNNRIDNWDGNLK